MVKKRGCEAWLRSVIAKRAWLEIYEILEKKDLLGFENLNFKIFHLFYMCKYSNNLHCSVFLNKSCIM
jgi:hypothetical protein